MLSDDEIRSALLASGLHHVNRTVITRWKDGIDLDFPISEVVAFARAVERAAYERAKEACAITCAKKHADAAAFRSTTKAYIAACDDCADAIRALGRQR